VNSALFGPLEIILGINQFIMTNKAMKYIKFYPVTISASSEGSIGDKMLTGRVVGVLERSTRDYVVSMPEEEVESRSSKVSALVNIP